MINSHDMAERIAGGETDTAHLRTHRRYITNPYPVIPQIDHRRESIAQWLEGQDDNPQAKAAAVELQLRIQAGAPDPFNPTPSEKAMDIITGPRTPDEVPDAPQAQQSPTHNREWSISTRASAIHSEANPAGLDKRCPEYNNGENAANDLVKAARTAGVPTLPPHLSLKPWKPIVPPTNWLSPKSATVVPLASRPETTPALQVTAPTPTSALPAVVVSSAIHPNPAPALRIEPPTPTPSIAPSPRETNKQPHDPNLLIVPALMGPVAPLPGPQTIPQEGPSQSIPQSRNDSKSWSSWHGRMVKIQNIDTRFVSIESMKKGSQDDHQLMIICYEVRAGENWIVYAGFKAKASAEVAQRQINGSTFGGNRGVVATLI